jgi:hypothetical protein
MLGSTPSHLYLHILAALLPVSYRLTTGPRHRYLGPRRLLFTRNPPSVPSGRLGHSARLRRAGALARFALGVPSRARGFSPPLGEGVRLASPAPPHALRCAQATVRLETLGFLAAIGAL